MNFSNCALLLIVKTKINKESKTNTFQVSKMQQLHQSDIHLLLVACVQAKISSG